VTTVQRRFGTSFDEDAPSKKSSHAGVKIFCIMYVATCKGKNCCRPSTSEQHVDRVRAAVTQPQLTEDFPGRLLVQQDAAPSHFHLAVTVLLYNQLTESWIGSGGLTPWPPRSPDLSTLDFF
jgi:hypothetical protein